MAKTRKRENYYKTGCPVRKNFMLETIYDL